jgi:hypothetical protein
MIKLMEVLGSINYMELIDDFYEIKMEGIEIVDVDILPDNPNLIIFRIDVTMLHPNTINILYSKVVEVLKKRGLGESLHNFTIRVSNIIFTHPSGLLNIFMNNLFPHNIMTRLKYDDPPLNTIDNGNYSLVLPDNEVTRGGPDLDRIFKIKIKSASTYYEVYKKGKVQNNFTYELEDKPKKIWVDYVGKNTTILDIKNFIPNIESSVMSINGAHRDDPDFERHLQVYVFLRLNEKFEKHGIYFEGLSH